MSVMDVVEQLEKAREGFRELDMEVAKVVGWRRSTRAVTDAATNATKIESVWINPASEKPGRVPRYTTNIQSAYELVQQLVPSSVGAVKWDKNGGSAWMDLRGEPVIAATPALALCAATLRIYGGTTS
jgi:hypothetical protein